jgi:ParB family chromosome partitioning protein
MTTTQNQHLTTENTKPAVAIHNLQSVPLAAISANPNNPRKHFDQIGLKELADSIKVHGVRQPVLLRPNGGPGKFQLVCGERRWRASKIAGKAEIPAIVDPTLTDQQALEIGVLENLQREGVHPLDEAMGYEALLKMPGEKGVKVTVEALAAKVAKSVAYVYARCKLLSLVPAGREAFLSERISAAHAVLIARLQPKDQIKAVRACFGEWHGAKPKADDDPVNIKLASIVEADAPVISEKSLREWIQDNVNLQLKGVPWDLNDAQLLPAAGACSSCPKRSASNPALFAELTVKGEDTCFDADCFKAKREAFVEIAIKQDKEAVANKNREAFVESVGPREKSGQYDKAEPLRQISEQAAYAAAKPDQKVLKAGQWLPAKKNECPSVEAGLIVRGDNAGTKRLVCCNGACKVHKHTLSASRSSGRTTQVDCDLERYKGFKKQVAGKKKAAARAQLVRAMVERVGAKIPAELLREVVINLMNGDRYSSTLLWLLGLDPKAAKASDCNKIIGKAKDVQLNQLLVAALLLGSIGAHREDAKERPVLLSFGKVLGLKTAPAILAAQDERISKERACRGCGCTEETPCDFWNGDKRVACSWIEQDLCSNPDCKKYAPPAKVQASAKSGGHK